MKTREFSISTDYEGMYNITARLREVIRESGVQSGLAVVYCPHTTAGITINENADPDVQHDLLLGLREAFPDRREFRHAEGNSTAHLKCSYVGPSQTVLIEDGKPILGICRGIQVLNAFLGGELYQDIKPLEHVPHNDHWAKIHTVTVRRGTLLAEILKQDTVLVNSQHHQAASRVAPGLEIAALSEDGFIEALEKPDATFCLGVQWHPEWLSEADPRQQALFDAFVKACH